MPLLSEMDGQRQDHWVGRLTLGKRTLTLPPQRQGGSLKGVAREVESYFFPKLKPHYSTSQSVQNINPKSMKISRAKPEILSFMQTDISKSTQGQRDKQGSVISFTL